MPIRHHISRSLRSFNRPLDTIATDQMDVDTGAMLDYNYLDDDDLRTEQATSASAMAQDADVIDLLDVEEEGPVTCTSQDQQDHPPDQPQAKKLKVQSPPPVIGLSLPPRNSHREYGQVDAKSLHLRPEGPHTKILELQKTVEELERENAKAGRDIDRLKGENDAARQENQRLHQWLEYGQQQYEKLTNGFNNLVKDLEREQQDHRDDNAQLKTQINDLTQANDQFRQMIAPVSEKQVPDCDLVSKFMGLRVGILGLVRQTWKTSLKEDVDFGRLSRHQREFFGSGLPLTFNRLRSVVFQIIHSFILGSPNYFLGESFQQIEHNLQAAEQGLYKHLSKENHALILEWRNAAFQATETLRDSGGRLSSATQDEIWSFLSPLQAKDTAAEEKGRKKLQSVCDTAVELSLMMRQSKDCFWVYDLRHIMSMQIAQCERLADEITSVAVVDGHAVGTVAYVITGLLVKLPKDYPKKKLVLEKGEVAVYQ